MEGVGWKRDEHPAPRNDLDGVFDVREEFENTTTESGSRVGFPCAQVNLTHTENLEPLVQNALDDEALLSLLDDVGLDDGECSLFGHCGRIYTYSAERGQNLAQESRAL